MKYDLPRLLTRGDDRRSKDDSQGSPRGKHLDGGGQVARQCRRARSPGGMRLLHTERGTDL
jgi:hypothetical protein